MARYDKEAVKDAAGGRWPEIISRLASVPESILDGSHHPCPKCGGNDRFNIDRNGSGSCYCNECKPRGTGNGIDSIIWLADIDYKEALAKVADAVGVKPEKRKGIDPAEHLDFMPWNQTLIGMWCLKKKPIKPAAIQAIGGRLARYQNQFTVVAIPVWGPALEKESPVGWIIYRADGGQLPKKIKGSDEVEWVKVKLTAGSRKGIIAKVVDGRVIIAGESGPVWKTEGPTDLLGLLSIDPSANAFTTANGAKEIPADWIIKALEGRQVFVVHDADTPGQDGATWVGETDGRRRPGWCPSLAKVCSDVRNVRLPFEISPDHGQDLRDYLNNGITDLSDLLLYAETAERFGQEEATKAAEWIDEAEDDPQRLARVNLKVYEEGHSGRLIYWRDEWWKWKTGKYRRIETSELRAKVWAAVRNEFERCWKGRKKIGDDKPVKKVTNALISNVIGAMESICCIPSSVPMPCWMPDRSQPHYVSTINGILNLDAVFGKRPVSEWMIDHSPDWFSAFRLDYPFDPDAECPKWIDYISYSMDGDEERIAILQEWAGYLLTGSNDLQKFLVLEGEGSNGKTVFFSGMTAMLGEDNVSHVSIENFGGRFELGTTIGKSANISGDAGEIEGIAEGVLKQFTGGDIMQFDRKNLSPISARPTAKLMAAWNGRPRIKDKSMGLWRRMLLVPFNRKVEDGRKVYGMDKPEWWIKQKEAPGILLWAIAGLYRLRQQGGFTRSKIADDAIYEYREESNPAMRFLHERVSFFPKEILDKEAEKDYADQRGVKADDLYLRYKEWCRDESVTPLAKQNFGKQIARQFGNLKHRRGARGDRYFVYRLLTIEEDF